MSEGWANGNSFTWSSGGSYGNSAASLGNMDGGGGKSLPSILTNLLSVNRMADQF